MMARRLAAREKMRRTSEPGQEGARNLPLTDELRVDPGPAGPLCPAVSEGVLPSIGSVLRAERSKLLHLERPWLVPIADTCVTAAYRDRSAARAEGQG